MLGTIYILVGGILGILYLFFSCHYEYCHSRWSPRYKEYILTNLFVSLAIIGFWPILGALTLYVFIQAYYDGSLKLLMKDFTDEKDKG